MRASFRWAWVLWEQTVLPFQVRRHGIDVLHSPGYVAPAVLPCRSVVTIHDLNYVHHPEDFSTAAAMALKVLVPLSARGSHKIITVSENSAEDVVAVLGIPKDRICVIYEAANDLFSAQADAPRKEGKGRRGVYGKFILAVSASWRHKNLCRLVEAHHRLRSEYSIRHQLVLVGPKGRDHTRLVKLISDLDLQDHVLLTGWVPWEELGSLYDSADVLMFPSLFEGFGIPVLEAMTFGLPVVSSGAASLPEVVGDAALVVDPCDIRALAEAIYWVLSDPELRADLQKKGHAQARKFSWSEVARRTLAVYEEVVEAGTRG